MNTEKLDLDNLTQDDFLEMAKYVAHVENQNRVLLEQLKECKSAVLATVQQRNSLNAKLQNMILDKVNTIDIQSIQSVPMNTSLDLINPEQWAVPEGRVITTPKSNKI
jgi:hypothetical protein